MVGKIVPDPFIKKAKLSTSLDQRPEMLCSFVFIVCPSGCVPKYTKTKAVITCFDFILGRPNWESTQLFSKTKRVLDLVFLSYFLYGF